MINKTAGGVLHDSDTEQNLLRVAYFQYDTQTYTLVDLQVLNQTQDHRQLVLVSVAKELQNWMVMVRKMKAIYHTLNMFSVDVSKKCLIAECWVPVRDLAGVRKALADGGVSFNCLFVVAVYTGVC